MDEENTPSSASPGMLAEAEEQVAETRKELKELEALEARDEQNDRCCTTPGPQVLESLTERYERFAARTRHIVYDRQEVSGLVLVVVLLASVTVGIQTYDGMESNHALEMIDVCILGVFVLEMLVKIVAEGLHPYRYFTKPPENRWNIFDFTIVVLALPVWGDTFGGGSVAILRLFRLMRLVKLFKKVPQLQMIASGILSGVQSVLYIFVLLFLVFYLYAVVGVTLFRRNDPWHFKDLVTALVTLFRAATMEDWTDIMYISIFGCDKYKSIYIATEEKPDANPQYWCKASRAQSQPALAAAYWMSFITVTSMVMMSLFIGAVCQGMAKSMDELRRESKRKTLLAKKERRVKRLEAAAAFSTSPASPADFTSAADALAGLAMGGQSQSAKGPSVGNLEPTDPAPSGQPTDLRIMRSTSNSENSRKYITQTPFSTDGQQQKQHHQAESCVPPTPPTPLAMTVTSMPVPTKQTPHTAPAGSATEEDRTPDIDSVRGRWTSSPMSSVRRGTLAVKQTFQLLGLLESPAEVERERQDIGRLLNPMWSDVDLMQLQNHGPTDSERARYPNPLRYWYHRLAIRCSDLVRHNYFTACVTVVILMAGVLVGLQTDKAIVDKHGAVLQLLDQIILWIFVVEFAIKVISAEERPLKVFRSGWNTFDFLIIVFSFALGSGTVAMLRLLRLLRILRLVKALPQLQMIVSALVLGIKSIGYIAIILFVTLYVFGILGMILFARNDPWHFGTLHIAMITLFRCATLEDWSDVMYTNMYGCDVYGYEEMPEKCKHPEKAGFVAAVYFILFTFLAALILLTVFIGVVTTSMDESRRAFHEQQEIKRRVAAIGLEHNISKLQLENYARVFDILDLDGGGTVDEDELRIGLAQCGKQTTPEQMRVMMAHVDNDDSGEVDLAEFTLFMVLYQNPESRKKMEEKRKAKEEAKRKVLEMEATRKRNRGTGTWRSTSMSDFDTNLPTPEFTVEPPSPSFQDDDPRITDRRSSSSRRSNPNNSTLTVIQPQQPKPIAEESKNDAKMAAEQIEEEMVEQMVEEDVDLDRIVDELGL